jgi:fluoride exporter
LQKYFYIALGGSLGSVARFWVGTTVAERLGTRFPFGTFVINVTACAIIGFSLAFLDSRTELTAVWRYLIPVGFVGAYSTFSTFEWETFSKLEAGALMVATSYMLLSIVIGLFAVWCGVVVARIVS